MKLISPESTTGSFIYSVLIHVGMCLALMVILKDQLAAPVATEEYLDLGYQTFDEPPPPAEEVRKTVQAPQQAAVVDQKAVVDKAPEELQDEKGEVAGTQQAPKVQQSASEGTGTAVSAPYYKIKPKYPKAALLAGTEGWVLMQVDITENGEVDNIRIVDGEQRNLFQSEARRAVSQWKYRPFVGGDGNPIRKENHQVRVDFKLNETTEIN